MTRTEPNQTHQRDAAGHGRSLPVPQLLLLTTLPQMRRGVRGGTTLEVAETSSAAHVAVAARRWPACGATAEPTREQRELILVHGEASSSRSMDFLKQVSN